MKALKKLAVFCVGAALTVGSAFGFAACDNGTDPQGYDDPNIREVYSLYVASAEESGNEPMTYEEWLASIKGEDGAPGENGKDGSSFLHGEGAPEAADGKAGDLYLDVLTGDLYEKDANGWSADPVGNLKGPKGDKGDSATGSETEPADAIKTWDNVTISKDAAYEVDVSGVSVGLYWLIADTETEAAYDVLKVSVTNNQESTLSPGPSSYDMYSASTSGYKGVIYVDGVTNPTITTTADETISASLKLVKYESITLTAGTEIEVPVCSDGKTVFPLQLDSALLGQLVTVTATLPTGCDLASVSFVRHTDPLPSDGFDPATSLRKNRSYVNTLTIESTTKECYIQNSSTNLNVIIKIEVTAS